MTCIRKNLSDLKPVDIKFTDPSLKPNRQTINTSDGLEVARYEFTKNSKLSHDGQNVILLTKPCKTDEIISFDGKTPNPDTILTKLSIAGKYITCDVASLKVVESGTGIKRMDLILSSDSPSLFFIRSTGELYSYHISTIYKGEEYFVITSDQNLDNGHLLLLNNKASACKLFKLVQGGKAVFGAYFNESLMYIGTQNGGVGWLENPSINDVGMTLDESPNITNTMINTSWVSYSCDNKVDKEKSSFDLETQNIIHYNTLGEANMIPLGTCLSQGGNVTSNGMPDASGVKFRDYTHIEKTNALRGVSDINLNYVTGFKDLTIRAGSEKSFTVDIQDEMPIANTPFIENGAYPSHAPASADRIVMTTNAPKIGDNDYLCTWLYHNDGSPVWMDRYIYQGAGEKYDKLPNSGAFVASYTDIIDKDYNALDFVAESKLPYFDKPSDVKLKTGCEYVYHRVGRDDLAAAREKIDIYEVLSTKDISSTPIKIETDKFLQSGELTLMFDLYAGNDVFFGQDILSSAQNNGLSIRQNNAITPVNYTFSDGLVSCRNHNMKLVANFSVSDMDIDCGTIRDILTSGAYEDIVVVTDNAYIILDYMLMPISSINFSTETHHFQSFKDGKIYYTDNGIAKSISVESNDVENIDGIVYFDSQSPDTIIFHDRDGKLFGVNGKFVVPTDKPNIFNVVRCESEGVWSIMGLDTEHVNEGLTTIFKCDREIFNIVYSRDGKFAILTKSSTDDNNCVYLFNESRYLKQTIKCADYLVDITSLGVSGRIDQSDNYVNEFLIFGKADENGTLKPVCRKINTTNWDTITAILGTNVALSRNHTWYHNNLLSGVDNSIVLSLRGLTDDFINDTKSFVIQSKLLVQSWLRLHITLNTHSGYMDVFVNDIKKCRLNLPTNNLVSNSTFSHPLFLGGGGFGMGTPLYEALKLPLADFGNTAKIRNVQCFAKCLTQSELHSLYPEDLTDLTITVPCKPINNTERLDTLIKMSQPPNMSRYQHVTISGLPEMTETDKASLVAYLKENVTSDINHEILSYNLI